MLRASLLLTLLAGPGCGTLPDGSPAAVHFHASRPYLNPSGPPLVVRPTEDARPAPAPAGNRWGFLIPLTGASRHVEMRPEEDGDPVLAIPVAFQTALIEAASAGKLFREVLTEEAAETETRHWILASHLTRLETEITTRAHGVGFLMVPFWLLGVPTGEVTTRMELNLTMMRSDGSQRWEGFIRGERRRLRGFWFQRDLGVIVAEDVASIFAEGWRRRRDDIEVLIGGDE